MDPRPAARSFAARLATLSLLLVAVRAASAQTLLHTAASSDPETLHFGQAVAGVPDADGDGRGDLLVGAPYEDDQAAFSDGQAYLFSGATGALLYALPSPNPQAQGFFGSAVAGVPDVDGDGRGDLLVGAYYESGGAARSGRAYLFSGATGALLYALVSPNPESHGYFGSAVAGVPDLDGDGTADFLIGAPDEAASATDAGRAYLFSGATGALLRTFESPSPMSYGEFGWAVSAVPDADGDGTGDLLISALEDAPATNAGRAYLFSGSTGDLLHTFSPPNPSVNGRFGVSVSGVEDADGDGRGDLLVGAVSDGSNYGGVAFLYSGATGGLLRSLISPAPGGGSSFGEAVTGVPDVDGDERGDLLVGAFSEDTPTSSAGRAYLFSGATGALLQTLESPTPKPSGHFGVAVAATPDTNGDGRADLLIGAFREDGVTADAGQAHLFSGDEAGLALTASGNAPSVFPGDSVTVTAVLTNVTAQPMTLELWVVATQYGDPFLTELLGSFTVPATGTLTHEFDVLIPGGTPLGEAIVSVKAGDFPDSVVAAGSFPLIIGSDGNYPQPLEDWLVREPGIEGVGVVTTDDGFIYVAGRSALHAGNGYRSDIHTIKYDLDGNRIWLRQFDETDDGTNGTDAPGGIALDPFGNVIVTGVSYINTTGDDAITLKYAPDGTLLWEARAPQGLFGAFVETDAAGNVYVAGRSASPAPSRFLLIKYDPDGNELWTQIHTKASSVRGLAVNPAGEAVLTGQSSTTATYQDVETVFYEPDGTQRWARTFTSAGARYDSGSDVARGPGGEVYVGGHVEVADFNLDTLLIRYDEAGNEVWVRTHGGQHYETTSRVMVDSRGDIVLTGVFDDPGPGRDSDQGALKYDDAGNQLWVSNVERGGEDFLAAMAIGPDDAIYITGSATSNAYVISTARFDPDGRVAWAVTTPSTGYPDTGHGVAVDATGNVVVNGDQGITTVRYVQEETPRPPSPLPSPTGRATPRATTRVLR